MTNNTKTIFFLGAGFSAPAGGPIQNQIIKTLLSDEFKNNQFGLIEKSLLDFRNYLSKELFISEDKFEHVALEDIFTPIDRCLTDGKSLGKKSNKKLSVLREEFHLLMAKAIQHRIDNEPNRSSYIDTFAKYINNIAKNRINTSKDNVSIITTNWDILLDNSLSEEAVKETQFMSNGNLEKGPIAVVDYCCYISSLEDDDYIKPGLLALGRGGYNIKYLKLHGSMNWLHCPSCQRMYVMFNKKTMFNTLFCKHCKQNFNLKNNPDSIKLKGNLLLPTFLKDLSNIQIQLVWQNAGIELSEATKIVFIGYSLPAADFEIRQLLSRFVRKNAEIEVVLYPDGSSIDEEENRYRIFFGQRNIKIIKQYVPQYVNSLDKHDFD